MMMTVENGKITDERQGVVPQSMMFVDDNDEDEEDDDDDDLHQSLDGICEIKSRGYLSFNAALRSRYCPRLLQIFPS